MYDADLAQTACVGENVPVIQFEGGEYPVPDAYVGDGVGVRHQVDEIVIVHVGRAARTKSRAGAPRTEPQPRNNPESTG